ncbi:DNA/RNA non-specific endonuclease [Bacillus cereus]|uniref:DNA/RNA non-specific endonuclease n=1 Tax=Bacillus thuringiensis TaxID=1428 RepID=UPI000A3C7F9F|nr:DNA/RNA non-specific endonuclease [Bacillus thuringiensis]MEC3432470.1 DNA/RNA non-specific endonuclease [Bacillus cereus]MRC96302.1 cytoplasmic protein [Bacillus thuringiensis]HDR4371105.1 cytoplasmic protein [Bacillus cereus]
MLDRLSRENYIIENTLAKVADSVSPIFKGVEILPDGSVVRSGTNYSGKFQEAHDASKASIQSRISNLEIGGVKGMGEGPVKVNYGEQYAREKRKKILKPDVEYTSKEGYTYTTDSQGRVASCEGSLQLGDGKRNNYAQRVIGGNDRLDDDKVRVKITPNYSGNSKRPDSFVIRYKIGDEDRWRLKNFDNVPGGKLDE